jgi:hypothetical protein
MRIPKNVKGFDMKIKFKRVTSFTFIIIVAHFLYPSYVIAEPKNLKDLMGDIVNQANQVNEKKVIANPQVKPDNNKTSNSNNSDITTKVETTSSIENNAESKDSIFDKPTSSSVPNENSTDASYDVCSNWRGFYYSNSPEATKNIGLANAYNLRQSQNLPLYHACCARADTFINLIHSKETRIKELFTDQQLNLFMESTQAKIAVELKNNPEFSKNAITLWKEMTALPEWKFWYPRKTNYELRTAIAMYSENKDRMVPACVMVSQEEMDELNRINSLPNWNLKINAFGQKWRPSHQEKVLSLKRIINFTDNLNDLPKYHTP